MKIAEVFESVSGEIGGITQGSPCTFVRMAGCNLDCPFCDTKWANSGKHIELSPEEVAEWVHRFPWKQVVITGGEPLTQKEDLQKLINLLKFNGYEIQIETNGSIRIDDVYLVDYWVIDYKGPDAMKDINGDYQFNPGPLSSNCWVKYIVGSADDLTNAITLASVMLSYCYKAPKFSVSKVHGIEIDLVGPILRSKLPIILNLQIHKLIGAK